MALTFDPDGRLVTCIERSDLGAVQNAAPVSGTGTLVGVLHIRLRVNSCRECDGGRRPAGIDRSQRLYRIEEEATGLVWERSLWPRGKVEPCRLTGGSGGAG